MPPGARNKFGTPMFEPGVFRKQMYCIEEVLVTLLGLSGHPSVFQRSLLLSLCSCVKVPEDQQSCPTFLGPA